LRGNPPRNSRLARRQPVTRFTRRIPPNQV
jgi:hypothetical protein